MPGNRVVVYQGPGEVSVESIDYPKLELPDDVVKGMGVKKEAPHAAILKIVSTNICGSDQHMVRGRTTAPVGQTLGHEITGEVIETGNDVLFVKEGDICSVPFNIACGRCRMCKTGNTGVCLNVNPDRPGSAYGYVDMGGWVGGQAEYVMVPYADWNLLKFPDKDQAMEKILDLTMLSDIFPTGFHGAYTAGVKSGSTVYIAGAGPVGLAAAAHVVVRGLSPLVLERGPFVGASLLAWGHVRVFSPWSVNIDGAARSLLEESGWTPPDPNALPTGSEIVRRYLAPLAEHPSIAPHVILGATVTGIARTGLDKAVSAGREAAPFVVRWRDAEGGDHETRARALIDASGTWSQPNPMGADGLPVAGETECSDRIAYGIPDVLGAERKRYAGRRVFVAGSGHSAINVVLDLLRLQETAPATRVTWALRRNRIGKLLGGGLNDHLPARGALGLAAKRAIDERRLDLMAPFAAERIAG
ncbi:MAG: alcohol dehydrogenase catalytic domain-containing protein, partial [Burkholderiales bacterium]